MSRIRSTCTIPEMRLRKALVEQHYPAFREMPATAGCSLPNYIEQECDAYLKCGRLDGGITELPLGARAPPVQTRLL